MNKIRNELKGFFTEHWKYMAVRTACKLNIFDLVNEGINTNEKIQTKLKANLKAIETLLFALVQLKFLEIIDNKYFLNNKSELLIDDNSQSLKNACILWGDEHLDAWQELDYTIKTGKPAFEKSNIAYFDYLAQKPDKLENYHKAMHEYAIEDYKDIHKFIDFNKYKSVMDIGGSLGALISNIKDNTDIESCYLFDKKEVISLSKNSKTKLISGDFFENIPKLADCLVLSRIIHDWEDDKANIILRNCYNALPENGEIILIENFIDKLENKASLLSLNMMIMCKSFERTEREYVNLLENNKFKVKNIKQLNNLQYIIIASKI